MRFAEDLSGLGCCRRRQVGCVVVTPELTEVVAIGYNGPPAGIPNDSCRDVVGQCGCVHAEASALCKLRTTERDLVLVGTVCPCEACAGLVLNSRRIGAVVYAHAYRDDRGLELLRMAGLVVVPLTDVLDVGTTP